MTFPRGRRDTNGRNAGRRPPKNAMEHAQTNGGVGARVKHASCFHVLLLSETQAETTKANRRWK